MINKGVVLVEDSEEFYGENESQWEKEELWWVLTQWSG